MGPDVLEEPPFGPGIIEDAAEMGPHPAWIIDAAPPAGVAFALARVSARDEIHDSTPRAAVEGGNVVPDRSRIQGRIRHPRHESGRSTGFPLDVTHSPVSGQGDVEPQFEAPSPGT
nr:hypothetical protein [Paramagnetospirillum magneticum]